MAPSKPRNTNRRKPIDALRSRADYLRVQRKGKRFRGRHATLLFERIGFERPRVGLTISRKVGNAVTRNRVRRRFREITRAHPESLCSQCDHVFIALKSSADATFQDLESDFQCLLKKARHWMHGNGSESLPSGSTK